MEEFEIIRAEEVGEGERIIAQVKGREIAIFNVDGEYFAHTNWCPHQSGPVCEGHLTGTWGVTTDPEDPSNVSLSWDREDEILNCPWHGWEFDVRTGECMSNTRRLASATVKEKDGMLVVEL